MLRWLVWLAGILPCSGTVAVIYFDADVAVIAADSRVRSASGLVRDDACKIGVLAGGGAFVWSGAEGYTELLREATEAGGELRAIAERFAQSAADRFATLALRDPGDVARVLAVNGGGLLTVIVVGRDFEAYVIRIGGSVGRVTWEVTPLRRCELENFCVIGQVDVVTGSLKEGPKRLAEAAAVEKARSLIEKTRQAHPVEIGGPVDVVVMRRGEAPVWREGKAGCR